MPLQYGCFRIASFGVFTALGVALAAPPAAAELTSACDQPVDLRDAGESMEGLTQTAQGYKPTNLCGFYAFSTYLDSYRISRNSDRKAVTVRSSAIGVGVDNAIRRNLPYWAPFQNSTDPLAMRFGRWGSTFCALAKSVEEVGYCADETLATRTVDETSKFADVTTAVYAHLLAIAETSVAGRAAKIRELMPKIYGLYSRWGLERKETLLSPEAIQRTIEASPAKPYEFVRTVFFPRCADVRRRNRDFRHASCEGELYVGLDVLGIPSRSTDPLRTDRASRRLHALLERPHALPIPFAYCSAVLEDGKKYDGASPIGTDCGIHWSLIAGRKKIDGECHLLVRNSWSNPKYSRDWVLDRGDVWVREKELTRSMLMVQWLDE